jgi:hypothetical protein
MKTHSEPDYVPRLVLSGLCEYASDNSNEWPPYLLHLASSDVQGHIAWLSVGQLAAITTFCERTVRAGLRALEAAGAIRCVYKSSQGGSQNHPNCYLLTPRPASDGIMSPRTPVRVAARSTTT